MVDFLEDDLDLVRFTLVELLLQEPTAMLILAKGEDLTLETLELHICETVSCG